MTQYINLINPVFRRRSEPICAASLVVTLGVLVVVLIVGHVFVRQRADAAQRQLAEIEAQLRQGQDQLVAAGRAAGAVKLDPQLAAEVEASRAALQGRQNVMAALGGGALGDIGGFSEQFRAFARQSMDGLWLTGFTLSGGGREMLIRGRALSADLVPAYIRRLNVEQVFQGKPFASLLIEEGRTEEPTKLAPVPAKPGPYVEFRLVSSQRLSGNDSTKARDVPALRGVEEGTR